MGCSLLDIESYNKNKIINIFVRLTGEKKPRILFLSTYHSDYTRTETILLLLDSLKIKVTKIVKFRGYFHILRQLWKLQSQHDLIFVSFRGQEILPFIYFLTSKPIIFDSFVSMYDTLCFERKLFSPNSVLGKLIKRYELYLSRISSVVLSDTENHHNYFKNTLGVTNSDFIYLGCNKNLFKPQNVEKKAKFTAFWYGSVLPLQGLDIIFEAASHVRLMDNTIQFVIVGPVRNKKKLSNINYIKWIPYKDLPIEICKNHLCIGGHFSETDKSKRVVPGKAYQFVACGVPTIVGDNSANREVFSDEDVYFVEHNNAEKLAEAIIQIKNRLYPTFNTPEQ